MMTDLAVAKKKLFDSLGDNFKIYMNLLKIWFRDKLSKEQFDYEARRFLPPTSIHFHNEFLLALFTKCQNLTTTAVPTYKLAENVKSEEKTLKTKSSKTKKKNKGSRATFDHRFYPANSYEYTPQTMKGIPIELEEGNTIFRLMLCTNERSLPDHFLAHLRMFVTVWESGLDSLTDDAVKILNLAIRDFIKNILSAIFTTKSAFRVRDKGRFKHAIGSPPVNPYLKNSNPLLKYPQDIYSTYTSDVGEHVPKVAPTVEWAETDAAFEVACSGQQVKRKVNCLCEHHYLSVQKVTLWHLFHALKIHRSAIPSHTVYSINIERIITKLHHKGYEDDIVDKIKPCILTS